MTVENGGLSNFASLYPEADRLLSESAKTHRAARIAAAFTDTLPPGGEIDTNLLITTARQMLDCSIDYPEEIYVKYLGQMVSLGL